jgi:hypothetical protein
MRFLAATTNSFLTDETCWQESERQNMTYEVIFTPLRSQEAPPQSREILENARRHFGFVPNLLASMAYSPVALSVYFNANLGFEFGTLTLLKDKSYYSQQARRMIVRIAESRTAP